LPSDLGFSLAPVRLVRVWSAKIWGQDPVEHGGRHLAVVAEPVHVCPRDGLDGVAEMARHGREGGALGQQRRGAEMSQGVEDEAVGAESGFP
jgi:hypothetical protein